MEKVIPDKNGFVYFQDNKPACWLYAKLSPNKLKSSLPLSDTRGKTHLTAFFIDRTDYLGCNVESNIIKLINKHGEIVINKDSEPIGIWKNKYKKQFYEMKQFILDQLNKIE